MNIGDKDQVKAAFRDMAELLVAYKKSLEEQGFSPLEVMSLLVGYQATLLQGRGDK